MKTKFLFFGMLLSMSLTFGQATLNQSLDLPQGFFNNPLTPAFPVTGLPAKFSEIFRFRSGFIGQIDAGTGYGFTNDRLFSLGRVTIPTASQNFYGLRFQMPNRGLVMGYNTLTATNPVIQWIGTGANLGNLEFRVANTFGSVGAPGADVLVATMKNDGNTVFGAISTNPNNAKVAIEAGQGPGFNIESASGRPSLNINQLTPGTSPTTAAIISIKSPPGSFDITGLNVRTEGGAGAMGIASATFNVLTRSIAIFGRTQGTAQAEYGIYAQTPIGPNRFAGFFDGNVFTNGSYLPSDRKLKSNIKKEINAIDRISLLNPVTYNYNKISELNLPSENQHGFVSQELTEIFPELTKDITKPVFDNDGKIISDYSFKSINYNGLISILTAGIQELNNELKTIKDELATLKNVKNINSNLLDNNNNAFLEQNIPNPFANQTTIRYQLPIGVNNANIMVMDLNGRMIKNYAIASDNGEITIKASEIGKGFFIYSLVQNSQELVTKKMIIN